MFFFFILKQRKKILRIFFLKIADFQELNFFFTKLKTFKTHIFFIFIIHNLPCGQVMSHKKFGPIGSAVLTYWIQTNKQTPKQTDKPNLYIDLEKNEIRQLPGTMDLRKLTVYISYTRFRGFILCG